MAKMLRESIVHLDRKIEGKQLKRNNREVIKPVHSHRKATHMSKLQLHPLETKSRKTVLDFIAIAFMVPPFYSDT